MVEGEIKVQALQVMKNIAAVLETAGTSFDNVIKTTYFLKSMEDFAAFNEVYAQYFTGKPARSCVEVAKLPKDVLCEVEVIAVIEEELISHYVSQVQIVKSPFEIQFCLTLCMQHAQ